MASLSFSRSSATTVWFTATGLTAAHTYSLQVYGTKWVDKVTNLTGSTSYTKSFSVNDPVSYQARLWDATISGVAATGTIPAWSAVHVYAQCTDGVSQFTLYYGGATTIVSATSGIVSVEIDSGTTVSVQAVLPRSGYGTPYLLYYNTASDPYGKNGPREFSSSTSISDTSFDRRLWVGATSQSQETPVKPAISNVTTTATGATVYWNKNGGTDGEWRLYYGTSTSSLQLYGTISSSPVTLSGLRTGTTYYFVVRNWVAAGNFADSDPYQAATKSNVGAFAWTSSDGTLIASGQPVSNVTAYAWNNLAALVNQIRKANGYGTVTIPTVSSGSQITASLFNTMRGYIAGLTGAGSVTGNVASGSIIYAAYFANSTSALKEAVNRAAAAANQ